jgi:hypothetical protein
MLEYPNENLKMWVQRAARILRMEDQIEKVFLEMAHSRFMLIGLKSIPEKHIPFMIHSALLSFKVIQRKKKEKTKERGSNCENRVKPEKATIGLKKKKTRKIRFSKLRDFYPAPKKRPARFFLAFFASSYFAGI